MAEQKTEAEKKKQDDLTKAKFKKKKVWLVYFEHNEIIPLNKTNSNNSFLQL